MGALPKKQLSKAHDDYRDNFHCKNSKKSKFSVDQPLSTLVL